MRNHTATHILQSALRTVLGDHVKQAGSLVTPDRLRFDFTHFSGVKPDELAEISEIVNQSVLDNRPVTVTSMDMKEAVATGAMALFGEKYGDTVRVVTVKDTSKELCGGTHCSATGEIGPFIIESEGSVASGIRRIEAVTGTSALSRIRDERGELRRIAGMLKIQDNIAGRVQGLLDEIKGLERERDKMKGAAMKDASQGAIDLVREVNGIKVLVSRIDGMDGKDLRTFGDNVRDRIGSGIVVLASVHEGQASILAMVTSELTGKYKAGAILKAVSELAGGRGGGKPDLAQGGTKEIGLLDKALEAVYDIVKNS